MKKLCVLVFSLLSAGFMFNAAAESQIDAGKAAVAKADCASCHGADFNSPIDPTYPKLAGQHKDYLAHALTAYRRDKGDVNSRSNVIMGPIAKKLSDNDIQNIAAYLQSLPGSLVMRR